MGDNIRFGALNLGLKRYPHGALTSVRLKSKLTGGSGGKRNSGETSHVATGTYKYITVNCFKMQVDYTLFLPQKTHVTRVLDPVVSHK